MHECREMRDATRGCRQCRSCRTASIRLPLPGERPQGFPKRGNRWLWPPALLRLITTAPGPDAFTVLGIPSDIRIGLVWIGEGGVTNTCARRSICIVRCSVSPGKVRSVLGVVCALGALALASCGGVNGHSAVHASHPDVARSRTVRIAAVKPSSTCPLLVYCAPMAVPRGTAPARPPAATPARPTQCPTLVYCAPMAVPRGTAPSGTRARGSG